MEVIFQDEDLEALYEGKKTKNKAWKSYPQLSPQFIKAVSFLKRAAKIEHLQQFTSLNYHKLKGKRKGQSSVKVNQQFRLIFTEIPNQDDPPEIVILQIEELSKHYDD